jgi:hypothetical protein
MRPATTFLARIALCLISTSLLTELSLQIVHGLREPLTGTPLARVNTLLAVRG